MKRITIAIALVLASTTGAGEIEELDGLLDQAGHPAQIGDTVEAVTMRADARWAQRELKQRYPSEGEAVRDQFASDLYLALTDAHPTIRVAAVRTLAAQPEVADVERLLTAFETEQNTRVQRVLLRGIVGGVRQLALGDRETK